MPYIKIGFRSPEHCDGTVIVMTPAQAAELRVKLRVLAEDLEESGRSDGYVQDLASCEAVYTEVLRGVG